MKLHPDHWAALKTCRAVLNGSTIVAHALTFYARPPRMVWALPGGQHATAAFLRNSGNHFVEQVTLPAEFIEAEAEAADYW